MEFYAENGEEDFIGIFTQILEWYTQ